MRRVLGALSAALLLGAGSAHAYSNIFAFGDSLSDGGNAFALTSAANALPPLFWPPSPPAAQRFSNGLTAVEQLALLQGLPALAPSETAGGTNYAVGGATTGIPNFNYAVGFPPGLPATLKETGMQSQVEKFLRAGVPSAVVADSLFFLWGGANDIFLGFATGGQTGAELAVASAIGNLAGLVQGLAFEGARHFVVMNMPDLGSTPGGKASSNPGGLTQISEAFNYNLGLAMNQIAMGLPGVDITLFDTFALLANADKFPSLTNITSPCLANLGALSANCPGFLWFDEIHPTKLGHQIVAEAVNAQLIPEPGTWAMLAGGLVVLAVAVRRRRLA